MHAEIIVRDVGLKADSDAVSTPDIQTPVITSKGENVNETMCSVVVARGNFLSLDRPDVHTPRRS